MKPSNSLNLARAWRPQTFDEIVGQSLSVRLLKNSLYKQRYFPVYLFAGQRGSGKTTTARVFAAALNCERLLDFTKSPQNNPLPCTICLSCKAVRSGNHPDFTEIDAASNTGVDNVRQIIEGALFLPQLGKKKIYLIDEAHMLSKAAFNAFLKILEEPPRDVIFMMATTDPQKIIDTVRSRCFQLFFDPLEQSLLVDHLKSIAEKESISYEPEALRLLVDECEGSVRDALNMLEKIRLAHEAITVSAVRDVLQVSDLNMCSKLLQAVATQDTTTVLELVQTMGSSSYAVMSSWKMLAELVRDVIRWHHGVQDAEQYHAPLIAACAEVVSLEQAVYFLTELYNSEQQFLKTTLPRSFFELLLVRLCSGVVPQVNKVEPATVPQKKKLAESPVVKTVIVQTPAAAPEKPLVASASREHTLWEACKKQIALLPEPLFVSVMQQSTYDAVRSTAAKWYITIPKEMEFFHDVVQKLEPQWKKIVHEHVGNTIAIVIEYIVVQRAEPAQKIAVAAAPMSPPREPAPVRTEQAQPMYRPKMQQPVEKKNYSPTPDLSRLPKTQIMLRVFPGTVTQLKEYKHD